MKANNIISGFICFSFMLNIASAGSAVKIDITRIEKIKLVENPSLYNEQHNNSLAQSPYQHQATEGGDIKQNAEVRLEKIKKELNLNAEQTESLRKALTEHLQKLREIKNQAKAEGSRDGMKEKMKAENEQFKTTLKSILTAEQMEKFRNMDKGEGKNRGGGKRKAKKG